MISLADLQRRIEKGDLADIKVRQAIRYAIDVDAIIQGAYSGMTSRATATAPRRTCTDDSVLETT